MGTSILAAAVVIEIAFAAFSISTKSNQKTARSIMRIATFAVFVLLAVLQIIHWSLRYYALFLLLLVLAVIGAVDLISKKEEKREYKAMRVVLRAIGMTLLIFAVNLPAIMFPQNRAALEATGEYQVGTVTYTLTDASRIETYTNAGESRKLSVQLWYPENAAGEYPLTVFSHGSFGIRSSNESLYNELASHGYVVCSIDHTYQCLYTTDEDGHMTLIDRGYMQEVSLEDARSDRQQSYEYYQKWMKIRTDDLNFVIDHILWGGPLCQDTVS